MRKTPRLVAGMVLAMLLATLIPLSSAQAQASKPYSGRIAQTLTNCGLTQIFGTVADSAGGAKTGMRVRVSWPDGFTETVSGTYVRAETSAAGWDFTLDSRAKAATWQVALVDGSGNTLSNSVEVRTTDSCSGSGAANVVKVEFREGATPAPVTPPSSGTVAPAPISSSTDLAPAITAGARCQFYTQTASGNGGYSVCDDANASFLTSFNRYGLQNVGYPISQRFKRDGFITQSFQKAVLQWRPESNSAAFVNVFDELHNRGLDQQLLQARQTPFQLPEGWEGANVPFQQAVTLRQALLNPRPALRSAYFAVSDPMTFFGLPTSEVKDMGNHYAIRLQRAVLQEWKENVPWARAGQVTVANGADIAKELGHFPASVLVAETVPPTGGSVALPPAPPLTAPIAAPVIPPVPAPAPAPAPSEPARNLDARLGALGVTVEPANVARGQAYWRVVEVIFHDDVEAQGRHSIFVDVLDANGSKLIGHPVTVSWGSGSQQLVMEPKPFPEYGVNFPMYHAGCSYFVTVDGLASDKVNCLGLGILGDTRSWRTDHTEYLIKFQRAIK